MLCPSLFLENLRRNEMRFTLMPYNLFNIEWHRFDSRNLLLHHYIGPPCINISVHVSILLFKPQTTNRAKFVSFSLNTAKYFGAKLRIAPPPRSTPISNV